MIYRLPVVFGLVFVIGINLCFSQKVFSDYKELEGSIQVGPTENIKVDKTARGYTLLLPDYQQEIKGLVVIFEGRKITLSNIPEEMVLHPHAFRRGFTYQPGTRSTFTLTLQA